MMAPDDLRLAEIVAEQARLAAEAQSILARRTGINPAAPSSPARIKPDRLLSPREARKLSGGKGYDWLHKHALISGFGWKLPSNSWVFSERKLREFLGLQQKP